MKLQKLVYYSQAWSLVWDDRPLFDERIEAWKNGPVVRELYEVHKGKFIVDQLPGGDSIKVDDLGKETVDAVLKYYSKMNADQLSSLTHSEDPWQLARNGIDPESKCGNEISLESMSEYYSSIP